jgi:uncharacterized protein YegL
MSRRLPFYLLLDTSGSMTGTPINAVNQGIQVFQAAIRSDPRAIETAYVSLLTFDSEARQVVPLTSATGFSAPQLQAQGGTSLGKGLRLLEQCISKEVILNSGSEQKGDWKPVIFIMTDGQPTDDWLSAAESLKRHKYNVIACAAGEQADEEMLKHLSDYVLRLCDTTEQSIRAFFEWVTQSTKRMSDSVGTVYANEGIQLPPPPPALVIIP